MCNPLISVIVPVYKVEEFLSKCVDSILAQTYTNLEVFLVDDGSPDNCGKMCDDYAKKDSRIKVIHKENGGLSDARNVAIDVATGEYITFVDSDDYVAPTYVEELYNNISDYSAEVSVCLFRMFNEGTLPVIDETFSEKDCFNGLNAIEQMFYQEKFDTSAWAKMYHRSLFETGIRYPKGLLFEDLPTTYLLMYKAKKVAFINKKLYYYLVRSNSIEGSSFTSAKMDSALKIFELMESRQDIISQVPKAYKCRMLSFAFHILLKMPEDFSSKEILFNRIRSYRKTVLLDNKARFNSRVAALLSYFGLDLMKRVFTLIDKRK